MASLCKIISYNLHGLNNGLSCLTELCNDANIAIIAVQEHWLTKDSLYRLNNLHKDFVGCGISAMSDRLSSEIYRGRPFGGVGFLFRKNLASRVSILANDDSGRCSVLCLKISECLTIKLINVYFPCADGSINYRVELGHCLGFIESVASAGDNCIILGDMNFKCADDSVGFRLCKTVFDSLDLRNCDHLCHSGSQFTYCNEALGAASFIDHFFASANIFDLCCSIEIFETGCNLSDHNPVIGSFNFVFDNKGNVRHQEQENSRKKLWSWRWDRSDLGLFTRNLVLD